MKTKGPSLPSHGLRPTISSSIPLIFNLTYHVSLMDGNKKRIVKGMGWIEKALSLHQMALKGKVFLFKGKSRSPPIYFWVLMFWRGGGI